MKKLIFSLFVAVLTLPAITTAQYVTIPDINFRNALKDVYPTGFNAAGQMDTTSSVIVNAQTLDILTNTYFQTNFWITNLDGIQYFKSLHELVWPYGAALNTIPKFPPALQKIDIAGCHLSTLPTIPSTVTEFFAYDNQLISLPPLPSGLMMLNVARNKLTNLPALGNSLELLECSNNQLVNLPALPGTLTDLRCMYNKLLSLPALPPLLTFLECDSNYLSSIPALPATLEDLYCGLNQLTSLPALPASLLNLMINDNTGSLSFFSTVQLPPQLLSLDCSGNDLDTLPALPNSLEYLEINDNQFQSFPMRTIPHDLQVLAIDGNDIFCLPILPQTLRYLTLDSNKIRCLPNSVSGLSVYSSLMRVNLPICNAATNANSCYAFPVIKGKAFYDLNNNGIKDLNEPAKANLKINLSNGAYTFTNSNGDYMFLCNDTGTYKLNCLPGNLFKAVPDTSTFLLKRYDTIKLHNLVLQKLITKDSVFITVSAMERARPGFNFSYMINYENAGSTNLPATAITLNYNNSLLTYNSVSNAAVVNSGNSLSLNLPALDIGKSGRFIAEFTVKPTAAIGAILNSYAQITSSNITSKDSSQLIINGSFDPNDKTATPVLTPVEVNNGKNIDYLVRFQNTGTDTAFNIVIMDSLSTMLQAGSFEIVSASHPCIATIRNNIVSFEFRDILLPDHIINEQLSHGYVRFRIKPKSNLVTGNVIINKAAIYFDYNNPVITNTANTEIKTFSTTPLQLISFRGNRSASGKALLSWKTQDEHNTAFFVVESGEHAQQYTRQGQVSASGRGDHDYFFTSDLTKANTSYFRLKMVDIDGRFSYSNVISIHGNANDKAGFTILSNPVKTKLVLNNIAPDLIQSSVRLVNNQGVVVKQFLLTSASQIVNVENLPSGQYYLKSNFGVEKITIAR